MSKRKNKQRHCFRFTLRTLLIVFVISGVGLAWVALKFKQVREHREIVAEIEKLDGLVYYRHELDEDGEIDSGEYLNGNFVPHSPPGPAWLRRILGDDFFVVVGYVGLHHTKATDNTVAKLAKLTDLEELNLSNTAVSDVGMQYIADLTKLKRLNLSGTRVSNAGLAFLINLQRLTELDLSECRVTGHGFVHLRELQNLEKVNILSEQASKESVLALKKSLPQLNFEDRSAIVSVEVSPSGDRIALSVIRGPVQAYQIWILSVNDATIQQTAADAYHVQWHPDGSRIVCCSIKRGGLDLLNLTNKSVTAFAQPDCRDPQFSPDGTLIGYFDAKQEVLVIRNLATGEKVAQVRDAERHGGWCWATDSARVFYIQESVGDVCEYSLADATQRILASVDSFRSGDRHDILFSPDKDTLVIETLDDWVSTVDLGTGGIKNLFRAELIAANARCWNETGICAVDIPLIFDDFEVSRLCVFDRETGQLKVIAEGEFSSSYPQWLNAHEVVVAKKNAASRRTQIWSYDVRTGEGTCLFAFSQPGDES